MPPSIAPVAYTNRAVVVLTAIRRTLAVHRYDIPNPATAMPGQKRLAIKYVLALTRKTCTKAVVNNLLISISRVSVGFFLP